MPNTPRQQCRHIFTDGRRCGSPCLRHEPFCFYHHNSRTTHAAAAPAKRSRRTPAPFTLAIPEDRAAIQLAIGEVLRRIASADIDPRRAGLLLYGLQIASLNLPKPTSHPDHHPNDTLVVETTDDPIHGQLALPATLDDPDDRPGIASRLLSEWRAIVAGQSPEVST